MSDAAKHPNADCAPRSPKPWQRLLGLLAGSLRRQVISGMVLTVALMMALFVWDTTRRQQEVVASHQSELALAIVRSVAVSAAPQLAARDVGALQETLLGLNSYPDLRYAMVLDTQAQVLAHTDPDRRGQYLATLPVGNAPTLQRQPSGLVEVALPVMLNQRPIGWVRAGLSSDALEARLAQVLGSGLWYAALALLLTVAVATLISGWLTRRLALITQALQALQQGQGGQRVMLGGQDEAARLGAQFNAMLNALQERDQALKASESFKTTILDSVAAEVAVLDAQGVILAVNEHWRRFALDNSDHPGLPAQQTSVGTNYLQVCARVDDQVEPGALRAREGIRAVLDGSLPEFQLEYPCHAPHQQRWFTMQVRPLSTTQRAGAVITHTDVSAIRLAEAQGRFRNRLLELLASDTDWAGLLQATATGLEQLLPGQCCRIDLHAHGVTRSVPAHLQESASQTIVSANGAPLGAITCWHERATTPGVEGLALLQETAHLLGVAVERRRTQAALVDSEDTFRALFQTAPMGVLYQDAQGLTTSANPAAQRILGLTLDQLQGRSSTDPRWHAVREDGSDYPGELHPITLARTTGQTVRDVVMGIEAPGRGQTWILVSAAPLLKMGQPMQAYAVFEDITERYLMEQKIRQLAFFDPLTQLPNRRLLTDRMNQGMTTCKRDGGFGALLFLDLDNFKPLNDAHGHDVGDLLLIEVARRLRACLREVDTVARIGGDEFVVILMDLHAALTDSGAQAQAVAEKIRASLAAPYVLNFKDAEGNGRVVEHHCSASIGLTLFSGLEGSHEPVFQRADAAMYRAKALGRNRVQFDPTPA